MKSQSPDEVLYFFPSYSLSLILIFYFPSLPHSLSTRVVKC